MLIRHYPISRQRHEEIPHKMRLRKDIKVCCYQPQETLFERSKFKIHAQPTNQSLLQRKELLCDISQQNFNLTHQAFAQGNIISTNDAPRLQNSQNQETPKKYPQAAKCYRLGSPRFEDIAYIEKLQRHLTSKKVYIDSKNPTASEGAYNSSQQIFDGKYCLFELSQEQMYSGRKNNRINQFIQADDILQGSVGDCHYFSAIGSLAAYYPELVSLKILFQANPVGYNAMIIKTDDMYPYEDDQAVYAKPNARETWVILLEKAFAKAYESYQTIGAETPQEAFLVLTGAPSICIQLKEESDVGALKIRIEEAGKNGFLMATSGNTYLQGLSDKAREDLGLISGHDKRHREGNFTEIEESLATLFGKENGVSTPEQKSLQYENQEQDGIFQMPWKYYCRFYGNISICKISPTYVHTSLRMINNKKKSNYTYSFVKRFGANMEPIKVSKTLIRGSSLRKKGVMEFQHLQVLRTEWRSKYPGVYVISAKVFWKTWNDRGCFLTAHGVQKVTFQKINRSIAPQFKSNTIESFVTVNKSNSQKSSFQETGFKNILTETYFSMEKGISFIKTINDSKRGIQIETAYQLKGLKIIKPKSNSYKQYIKAGGSGILGFLVSPEGFSYATQYSISQVK